MNSTSLIQAEVDYKPYMEFLQEDNNNYSVIALTVPRMSESLSTKRKRIIVISEAEQD